MKTYELLKDKNLKDLTKEEKEAVEKNLKDFQTDVNEVYKKHGLMFVPKLQASDEGIVPINRVLPFSLNEVKKNDKTSEVEKEAKDADKGTQDASEGSKK